MHCGRFALQLNGKNYTQCSFCKEKGPVTPFLKVDLESASAVPSPKKNKKTLVMPLGAESQSSQSNT